MYQTEDLKNAVANLSSGSTVGMVNAELEERGIGSGPRDEILRNAKRIINRRARFKNLGIALIGLIVIAAGMIACFFLAENRNFRVQLPGAVMLGGLILSLYGIYNFFRNVV